MKYMKFFFKILKIPTRYSNNIKNFLLRFNKNWPGRDMRTEIFILCRLRYVKISPVIRYFLIGWSATRHVIANNYVYLFTIYFFLTLRSKLRSSLKVCFLFFSYFFFLFYFCLFVLCWLFFIFFRFFDSSGFAIKVYSILYSTNFVFIFLFYLYILFL